MRPSSAAQRILGRKGNRLDGEIQREALEAAERKGDRKDGCFHDSHLQDQLRALWTASCIHAGWEADTEPYDSTMVELWNRVCGRPDGWPDFRSFDGYMCEFLA